MSLAPLTPGHQPATRVVSMPGVEWFAEQDVTYRQEVLPPRVREFGITAQRAAVTARTSLARLSTAASPVRASTGSKDEEQIP